MSISADLTVDHLSRFLARIDRGPGCWTWRGSKDKKGYGRMAVNGTPALVHRLAYFFATDQDPGALFVCHRCDNPGCVRPDHLFLGTNADNVADMIAKGRNRPPARRLTAEQMDVIRENRSRLGRKWDHVGLARRFGVSRMTVFRVPRSV